jgi:hypothetical protein
MTDEYQSADPRRTADMREAVAQAQQNPPYQRSATSTQSIPQELIGRINGAKPEDLEKLNLELITSGDNNNFRNLSLHGKLYSALDQLQDAWKFPIYAVFPRGDRTPLLPTRTVQEQTLKRHRYEAFCIEGTILADGTIGTQNVFVVPPTSTFEELYNQIHRKLLTYIYREITAQDIVIIPNASDEDYLKLKKTTKDMLPSEIKDHLTHWYFTKGACIYHLPQQSTPTFGIKDEDRT